MKSCSSSSATPCTSGPGKRLAVRGVFGGFLMGLANLVPGISGGTMLVAAGIYRNFITAVAEVSTFRFRFSSMVLLGSVILAAGTAVVGFAGPVKYLVIHHRWVMYSLFIGLTLGGIPVVWNIVGKGSRSVWIGAVFGFAGMAALAIVQATRDAGGGNVETWPVLLVAGILGAGAMILPGVSGGYLLLVMGVYVSILGAVDAVKAAAESRDWQAMLDPFLRVILPVGIGIVIGIVAMSNILKFLLRAFEKVTLGVLIGLLVGAVVGLWPFQQSVKPKVGDTIQGQIVTEQRLETLSVEKYPTSYFTPSLVQVISSAGLVVAGFFVTVLIARWGGDNAPAPDPESAGGTG